jgi:sulfur-oxidizing protein SoxX
MRNAIRPAILIAASLFAGTAVAQAPTPPALVGFEIKDQAIPASLTGAKGDPKKGEAVVINRLQGNCLACHVVTALAREPYHGNTGPTLDGVAGRLSEGEIRLRLVDGTKINPETMMPSFYRVDGFNRVLPNFRGKPVLTAEQVEDVVAYLLTLKD